jgi:hypothetical protein
MKPEEFLKTVKNYNTLTEQIKYNLLVLYWISIQKNSYFIPKSIQELAITLRVSSFSTFPSYVSKYSKKIGGIQRFIKLEKGYTIGQSYENELNVKYCKRKEAVNLGNDLNKLHSKIADPDLSEYMREAINCFENDFLRSSIVMTWCWVYHILRSWIFSKHVTKFNLKCATWKSPIAINAIEDFENIPEGTVLETCKSVGIISKELFKTLKMHLDTRNSFAHASNKPSSPSIAEEYIATAIKEILPKLK